MNLKAFLKPDRQKIIVFLILMAVFEVFIFFIGFNVMIECLCAPPPEPCDCTLDFNQRFQFGIGAVMGISTHPYVIPMILIIYLVSCIIVSGYNRIKHKS